MTFQSHWGDGPADAPTQDREAFARVIEQISFYGVTGDELEQLLVAMFDAESLHNILNALAQVSYAKGREALGLPNQAETATAWSTIGSMFHMLSRFTEPTQIANEIRSKTEERTACIRCEADFHRNNPPGCELCGTCERCGCLDDPFTPNEAHREQQS